jgi:hypothetical protein
MPPGNLDTAILLALGLTVTGCGDKEDTGPCLSPEIRDTDDTDDTGDTGDTGPCLDYPQDTGDTGEAGDAAQADQRQPDVATDREAARRSVLARGVLPADVAKLLGKVKARE